jgi:integrase
MSLHLYAPGTRKGNRYWLAYGKLGGRVIEKSTGELGKAAAKAWLKSYSPTAPAARRRRPTIKTLIKTPEPVLRVRPAARPVGAIPTFGDALRAYAERQNLNVDDPRYYLDGKPTRPGARMQVRRLSRLVAALGDRPVAEIVESDLIALANRAMPQAKASTKNRDVITPARSALALATRQHWRYESAIKKFVEDEPRTRAVNLAAEEALIAATPEGSKKRLLLLWLFRQGSRITETLEVRWRRPVDDVGIDLELEVAGIQGVVDMYRGKDGKVKRFALATEVKAELARIPASEREGALFPWRDRHGVYRWLRPLAKELGIAFSPHCARHTVGTRLSALGASLRTSMDVLGHADPASSLRYQASNLLVSRAAIDMLGK